MPLAAFTVYQDNDVPPPATTAFSSNRRQGHDTNLAAIKENINPLTGTEFGSRPSLRKRKPSSSSALKLKAVASSAKRSSKSKRLSSAGTGKDRGRRKAVLGTSVDRNIAENADETFENETEHLRTALGNRNAYDLTVMPLANVTQAYDESQAASDMAMNQCIVEVQEHTTTTTIPQTVSRESDITMRDITSEDSLAALIAASQD